MSDRARPRVLVVDDEDVVRTFFTHALRTDGKEVVCAETGREGLDALASDRFSLVLLDINLPDIPGYDVLEAIRGRPELARMPVIMVTGIHDIESVTRCARLGVAGYLLKPVEPGLLRERVREALRVFSVAG